MKLGRDLSISFSGGALAGAINAIAFWCIVFYGVADMLHVSLYVPITHDGMKAMLYRQIVWGGLWGLLFGLPLLDKMHWFKRGLIIGLLPSVVVLFFIFPVVLSAGVFGTDYGAFTFVIVLAVNWLWGLIAAGWVHWMK